MASTPRPGGSPLDGLLDITGDVFESLAQLPKDIAEAVGNVFGPGGGRKDYGPLRKPMDTIRARGGLGGRGDDDRLAREMTATLNALLASGTFLAKDRRAAAAPIAARFAPGASPMALDVITRDLGAALKDMRAQGGLGEGRPGSGDVRNIVGRVFDLAPSPIAQGFSSALQKTRGWVELGRSFDRMASNARTGAGALAPRAIGATIGAGAVGGAAGVALVETMNALKGATERQSSQIQRLSLFNAPIAGASMALEMGDISRTMRMGAATERTGEALLRATDVMREQWFGADANLQNLLNALGGAGAGAAAEGGGWIGQIGDAIAGAAKDAAVGINQNAIRRGLAGMGVPEGIAGAIAGAAGRGMNDAIDDPDAPGQMGRGAVRGLRGMFGAAVQGRNPVAGFMQGFGEGVEAQREDVERARDGNNAFQQGWMSEFWGIAGIPMQQRAPLRAIDIKRNGEPFDRAPRFRNRRERREWIMQRMDPDDLKAIIDFNARAGVVPQGGGDGLKWPRPGQ